MKKFRKSVKCLLKSSHTFLVKKNGGQEASVFEWLRLHCYAIVSNETIPENTELVPWIFYFITHAWAFHEFIFDKSINLVTPWKQTLPGITNVGQKCFWYSILSTLLDPIVHSCDHTVQTDCFGIQGWRIWLLDETFHLPNRKPNATFSTETMKCWGRQSSRKNTLGLHICGFSIGFALVAYQQVWPIWKFTMRAFTCTAVLDSLCRVIRQSRHIPHCPSV